MSGTTNILKELRRCMKDKQLCQKELYAYVVPSGDAHNSEYTSPYDKRREYISNFNGSSGQCVVTQSKALLWTDGRYHLQAQKQLDNNWTLMKDGLPGVKRLDEWLADETPNDGVVGIDLSLINYGQWKKLSGSLELAGKELLGIPKNLVDEVWSQRGKPLMPHSRLKIHSLKYCGQTWQSKVQSIRSSIAAMRVDALFVSALDSIAWLFNLRGDDILYSPLFKSYAIVTADSIELFLHVETLPSEIVEHLRDGGDSTMKVQVGNYFDIMTKMQSLATANKKIWVTNQTPAAFCLLFDPKNLLCEPCPIEAAKAVKNDVEIKGMKDCCIRDSAALCQYFGYLQENVIVINYSQTVLTCVALLKISRAAITEVSAADILLSFRQKMDKFLCPSFSTISSSGPNSAIIHYDPTHETPSKVIDTTAIYLCDSGGHYKDGTTDITRTVHFAEPTRKEIEAYTLVIKSHIALARLLFPRLIYGHSLDVVSRQPFWMKGLDYMHGTGHGIGFYLNVHEGPQCISYNALCDAKLVEGMVLSNEPGYYEDGDFGIRFENVMFIKKADLPSANFKKSMCCFETISLVPMERKLIDVNLLSDAELDWINDYHYECLIKVSPVLMAHKMDQGLNWLREQTQPLLK